MWRRIAQTGRDVVLRMLRADLWLDRLGLLALAAYSTIAFALPLETFDVAPRSYRGMARWPEEAWAAAFAILTILTVLTLWSESRATHGPWCQITWQLHALAWAGIGLSFVAYSPSSWTSWILIGIGIRAEFVLWQGPLEKRYGREG